MTALLLIVSYLIQFVALLLFACPILFSNDKSWHKRGMGLPELIAGISLAFGGMSFIWFTLVVILRF